MHVHAVEPVLVRPGAGAAADRLQVHPAAAVRLEADEGRRAAGAVAGGDDPLGYRLPQGSVDQIDDALAGRYPSVDRRPDK